MSSILTVSQLNRYLASRIKSDIKLKGIALKGELSNCVINQRSGHAYFSVKDEAAVIRGVMFSSNVKRLSFSPSNGMKVLVAGDVTVYERDGILQITAMEISKLGEGEIKHDLDRLKKKLLEMGIFDPAVKKRIPVLPRKIAVVTSATGAALQDIINVISRRCPIVKLEVFPCQVQGEGAPDSIAYSLARADSSEADTIILGRGGGSDEDLMAFNTEKAVMAVYNCNTPVISAVGHEVDTSLADHAADLRAPTPSAAAELAVPDMAELVGTVNYMQQRLDRAIDKKLSGSEQRVFELESRLKLCSPALTVLDEQKKLEALSFRLENTVKKKVENEVLLVERYAAQLSALSPFNILDRGYSITLKNNNAVSASALSAGDLVSIRFSDGQALAEVKQVDKNEI